jgi:hypothetical protein
MKRFLLCLSAFFLLATPALASSCNVTEFRLVIVNGVQVAQMPPIADQAPITTSATSAQSATFKPETGLVRIWCDTQSAVVVAVNPTATTNNMPISAALSEYYSITPGGPLQKAAFVLRP